MCLLVKMVTISPTTLVETIFEKVVRRDLDCYLVCLGVVAAN